MQLCVSPAESEDSHTPAPCSSVFVQRQHPERGCCTCPGGEELLHFLLLSAPVQHGTLGGWQFEKTE